MRRSIQMGEAHIVYIHIYAAYIYIYSIYAAKRILMLLGFSGALAGVSWRGKASVTRLHDNASVARIDSGRSTDALAYAIEPQHRRQRTRI